MHNIIKLGILGCFIFSFAVSNNSYGQPSASYRNQTVQLPSKLQIAVEPEEIVLSKGITVGSPEKTIQIIVRETSGINKANLELAARPFTEVNNGNVVDAEVVKVGIATPQAKLMPGGLQRVDVTLGGFQQAGSYVGGIMIHDSVSGERQEIAIRVSVKDAWGFPTGVLLVAVLLASGINYWTKKGRRKNQLDRQITELQKTVKLAGGTHDLLLFDAAQLLEKAQEQNQEYRFERAEAALAEVEQKFAAYEQRQQGGAQLYQHIQELLHEVRELGEVDPQHTRLADELIQLLPKAQSDYEQTEAIVRQIEVFYKAYRLARKDAQAARERLHSTLDYVKKANTSKIELLLRDIDRLLNSTESMSAIDETNLLLQKVAYELSPERLSENILKEQQMQKRLETCAVRVKQTTGEQVKRIVTDWYERAEHALQDNRYEDVEEALRKLDQLLNMVERIKQLESRIKGRDPKMTELRRILRNCKSLLEDASGDALRHAEWDVEQAEAMLEGVREEYEPFRPMDEPRAEQASAQPADAAAAESEHLRPVTPEDLWKNVEQVLEDARQYPKLRSKIAHWREYCAKLIEFQEVQDLVEYLRDIQDELALHARLRTIRTQAESKSFQSVLKLVEQAEQLLLLEGQNQRGAYHRAEVLADAATALLDEKLQQTEFDQVISYVRSPKTASTLITYGTFASYFVVATILGLQILYAPNPDFGALVFEDYFSLILWAIGLEGAKLTITNVYETYVKKEG